MSPDKVRPPEVVSNQGAEEKAPADGLSDAIVAEPDSVAGQSRRRREAAHRLPPLADGYRDPLDALAGGGR
jgi:hypothetical protein